MALNNIFSSVQLDSFHRAVQSLKLYRRAEIQDPISNDNIIESLYIDPLPNNLILNNVLSPNTTILIGRKGTGKSTIIQRAQYELQRDRKITSAYIDIKTVYESAHADNLLIERLECHPNSMPDDTLRKFHLYKSFLISVIKEIKDSMKKRLDRFLTEKFKDAIFNTKDTLYEGLDNLIEDLDSASYENITGIKTQHTNLQYNELEKCTESGNIKLELSRNPTLSTSYSLESTTGDRLDKTADFIDILLRIFNINELLLKLKTLLNDSNIEKLYIFVDDFSELPESAMMFIVDVLLAPLNNWSEEFVKLKIAAYPGRIYYGNIDKTKIDEIFLDIYKLYGSNDVASMEEKAIDFTKRLVEKRIEYFCKEKIDGYFENINDETWRQLYFATMGIPRVLGYILYFAYEANLVYGNKISIKAIRDASKKYFEDKIESYFHMNKFIHESYSEKSSIFSLKELLEEIVKRAKQMKTYKESDLFRDISGHNPTSHFYIISEMESILSTLELNFFVTKYYELSDRDGRKVIIIALNYGLCQKFNIVFGRPTGKTEYRHYFVERIFDYTQIIQRYLQRNQEIICDVCNEKQPLDNIEALKIYGMLCPICMKGVCRVVNLSKKYEPILQAVNNNLLLPRSEMNILQTLNSENKDMFAQEIAQELDCSYQLVGKRGKILYERGLIKRAQNENQRRIFRIMEQTKEIYFKETEKDGLNLDEMSDYEK